MPIYEFYCGKCNTIYQFLSRSVSTKKIPNCPRCKRTKLKRSVSTFASPSGRKDGGDAEDGMPPIDDAKLEKAMDMLAREAEHTNDDDPRRAARLMRKLSDATGMAIGPGMEQALSRMEQGEDPDKVEQEMGNLLDEEEPFIMEAKGKARRATSKPQRDRKLYEL